MKRAKKDVVPSHKDLLDCPHCGGHPCRHNETNAMGTVWVVHCQDCSASVHDVSTRKATSQWNRRAKTAEDYWDAIDVLYPKHRMTGPFHGRHKGGAACCSDDSPSGWGNFGCSRCGAIVKVQKMHRKTIWPRGKEGK